MEFTWRKIAGIAIAFMSVFLIPITLFSDGMIENYQDWAQREANSRFTPWVLKFTSDIAFRTIRYEVARDGYRKFLELYPQDDERGFILLRYGLSLEEAADFRSAVEVFEQVRDEFAGEPESEAAKLGIDRIHYVRRR